MHRLLVSALFLLAALPVWAQPDSPLTITGDPEFPPISWNNQGKLKGLGLELAQQILTDMDIPFQVTPFSSWAVVQSKVEQGAVDLLVSAYTNKEREKHLSFSVPYLKSPVVVIVKKGKKFLCNSWDDMTGKKGVAGKGQSFGAEFDEYIQQHLDISYLPYQRAFEMLEENTADFLIIDLYPALIYSKLLMVEDKIEIMDKPITVQQLHMAFSNKSQHLDLLPEINERIKTLQKEGMIKKLAIAHYNKWHETFKQRQQFYAKAESQAKGAQHNFDATARDRGLERLARFVERETQYMEGGTGF